MCYRLSGYTQQYGRYDWSWTQSSPNHAPDDTEISYTKCRNAMRDQAVNSLDKPSQIFAQVTAEPDVQARLPLEENTNPSLRNQCKTPPVPQHLSNFTLPEER